MYISVSKYLLTLQIERKFRTKFNLIIYCGTLTNYPHPRMFNTGNKTLAFLDNRKHKENLQREIYHSMHNYNYSLIGTIHLDSPFSIQWFIFP